MSLWGSNSANSAQKPKYLANTGNGSLLPDCYGITEAAEQASGGKINHSGWNVVTQGTGPVVRVSISAAGHGYANGEALVFTANTTGQTDLTLGSAVSAAGSVLTDGNGAIVAVVLNSGGNGYTQAPVVTITTAAGANGVLVASVGGRAGRTSYETIVAMGSMT